MNRDYALKSYAVNSRATTKKGKRKIIAIMAQVEINVIIMTTTTNLTLKERNNQKKEHKNIKKKKKNTKMTDLNSTTIITTLNINGLNSLKWAEIIRIDKEVVLVICCL